MKRLINFIFATKENSYEPPAIKTNFLAFLIGFVVFSQLIFAAVSSPRTSLADDLTVQNILISINKERASRNLTALTENSMLETAAQYKSDDMQNRHYFSHTDPEGNYIWGKITAAGYAPYLQLGENLAIEFYTTESMVSAWMNSPTHRANILNDGFKDQGMGLTFGNVSQGQYFSAVANTFGTLVPKKNTVAPPSAPAPAPNPPPSPAPVPPATPSPNPQTVPQAKPVTKIRGTEEPSFALSSSSVTSTLKDVRELAENASHATTSKPLSSKTAFKINRNITLGVGLLLLLILLADLRMFMLKKVGSLDKKVNNLALLILCLLAIAFVYLM